MDENCQPIEPIADNSVSNVPVQQAMPTMMFTPPVITASMMPRPDPSVERQSAEEWVKIFRTVAESLINIYRAAGQEIVGQRQALSTLPSLLNRNESEQKLSTRLISECNTVEEAERLVIRTIGDLESECQASESIFNSKRSVKSLEDFYALLLEKEKKAKLGATTVMKKFISELPEGIKPRVQKKFTEHRRADGAGELSKEHLDNLYHLAREVFCEKYSKSDGAYAVETVEDNRISINDTIRLQNEAINDMQLKLDAFMVGDHRSNQNAGKRRNNPDGIKCSFCNKWGHTRLAC